MFAREIVYLLTVGFSVAHTHESSDIIKRKSKLTTSPDEKEPIYQRLIINAMATF